MFGGAGVQWFYGQVVSSNIYVAPEDIPASIKVHRDSQAQQREKRNGPKKTGPARILRTEAERKIEEDANIVMYRKILEKIKTTLVGGYTVMFMRCSLIGRGFLKCCQGWEPYIPIESD